MFCDFVIVLVMLSNIVRVGGIIYFIIKLFCEVFGLRFEDKIERKIGLFFIFFEFYGDIIIVVMFMIVMVGNLLV